MTNKPPVLILSLYYGALQVARSLGKKGIPVYGIDWTSSPIAGSSRYIKMLPCPESDEGLLNCLLEFSARTDQKPVLFLYSDYYLNFYLNHLEELADRFLIPINPVTSKRLLPKTTTHDLFMENDVPAPHTFIIRKDEALPDFSCFIETGTRPDDSTCKQSSPRVQDYILKPDLHDLWELNQEARSFIGSGNRVFVPDDFESLTEAIDRLKPLGDMVLQEWIPGPADNQY